MILADKIIHLRKKNGWSQEQLANELGISRQSVSKWESAMSIPDLDKIIKMSAIFGVSTDYLLKDEIEGELPSETKETDDRDVEVRFVDAETANTYLTLVEEVSKIMALAVSLFVLCPVPVLFFGAFSETTGIFNDDIAGALGAGVLFLLIILGVILLILNGFKLSKYEYLEKETIELEYGVVGIIEKKQSAFEARFRLNIALGVALCIGGVIPLILGGGFHASDFILVCLVCLLLTCIAVGVFLFVQTGMIHSSHAKLLQEGDYSIEEKEANRRIAFLPGIYWCAVTALYLGISFYFNAWERSWMVWPVAGVAYAAVVGILKIVLKKK